MSLSKLALPCVRRYNLLTSRHGSVRAPRSRTRSFATRAKARPAAPIENVNTAAVSPKPKSRWFLKGLLGTATLYGGSFAALEATATPDQDPRLRRARVQMEGIHRALRSIWCGIELSLDYKLSMIGIEEGTEEWKKVRSELHRRSGKRIVDLCFANGGVYVKTGQGLASLNHILPDEYCEEMAVLQDQAPTRSFDEVEQIFREDFGAGTEAFFKEIDPLPVAAASLAQVHRAVTHDGEEVAVKVQYIDMQERFEGDFATIIMLCDIATIVHKDFDFGWVMHDARAILEQELDFTLEARNAERCAKEITPVKNIRVPEIHWSTTSSRVLTTEFIHGCKVTDEDAMKRLGLDKTKVAKLMVDAFAHQIFNTGFIHADPHPGNMLACKNKQGQEELVLLDHGLYLELPEDVRVEFCALWHSIVVRNEEKMKKHTQALGVQDHKLLASMLFQRPFDSAPIGFGSHLSAADVALMQRMAQDKMDEIVDVMKHLPKTLNLIMRNINLVRSINKDLGAPVNRFVLMAHHALHGQHIRAYNDSLGLGARISRIMNQWVASLKFGLVVRKQAFSAWIGNAYIRFLQAIGRAPADLGVIDDFMMVGA